MYNRCLICGSGFSSLILNDLSMRKCVNCGLIWREKFDLPPDHYREKDIDLEPNKVQSRILNSKQRLKTFKKYVNLNNLLDIGTSEGIFLKTLIDGGYQNAVGLEPSVRNVDFMEKNNLKILRGDLNDVARAVTSNGINTVTMFHVIEHLPDPLGSLKLIFKSLKKGDRLVIETPDIEAYTFRRMGYKVKLVYDEHLFYFNQKNLKNIIVKAGFKVVAAGKRDFNHDHLSIKECLLRLGLLRKRPAAKPNVSEQPSFPTSVSPAHGSAAIFKRIIRKILNGLVIWLRRFDYIWIVAEK